jgi:hypothetical protein
MLDWLCLFHQLMRVREVKWSRALSLVREVALSVLLLQTQILVVIILVAPITFVVNSVDGAFSIMQLKGTKVITRETVLHYMFALQLAQIWHSAK